MNKDEIENYKKNAKRIKFRIGSSIRDVLKRLEILHNNGDYNFYAEIYGHKIYSVDVDFERDYKLILGKSEEELNESIRKAQNERDKRKKEIKEDAIKNMDERIKKGKEYIIEAKHELFEDFVKENSLNQHNPYEIDTIISYLKLLDGNVPIEEIAEKFFQEYPETGDWYTSVTMTNLAIYHKRGIELFVYITNVLKQRGREVEDSSVFLQKLRNINTLLESSHDYTYAVANADMQLALLQLEDNTFAGITKDGKTFISKGCGDKVIIGRLIEQQYLCVYFINQDGSYSRYLVDLNAQKVLLTTETGTILLKSKLPVWLSIKDWGVDKLDWRYDIAIEDYTALPPEVVINIWREMAEFGVPLEDGTLTIKAIIELTNQRIKKLKYEAQ